MTAVNMIRTGDAARRAMNTLAIAPSAFDRVYLDMEGSERWQAYNARHNIAARPILTVNDSVTGDLIARLLAPRIELGPLARSSRCLRPGAGNRAGVGVRPAGCT